jgi:protein-ribulosamine 3-kinase
MVDRSIWDEEVAVPEDVVSFVDDNVLKRKTFTLLACCSTSLIEIGSFAIDIPEGITVVSISQYGASYWTRTAQIIGTDYTGTENSFFLKVSNMEKFLDVQF